MTAAMRSGRGLHALTSSVRPCRARIVHTSPRTSIQRMDRIAANRGHTVPMTYLSLMTREGGGFTAEGRDCRTRSQPAGLEADPGMYSHAEPRYSGVG